MAPRALEAVLLFVEAARQEAATLEMLDQALQALGEGGGREGKVPARQEPELRC